MIGKVVPNSQHAFAKAWQIFDPVLKATYAINFILKSSKRGANVKIGLWEAYIMKASNFLFGENRVQ